MTEAVALKFENASADDIQRISSSRSSKYTALVEACLSLSPDKAIKVPVPADEEASKMRINVSNAVRDRVSTAWKAEGKDQHVRIVRGTGKGGDYIAIMCKAGVPAPRAPRTAPAKGKGKGKK